MRFEKPRTMHVDPARVAELSEPWWSPVWERHKVKYAVAAPSVPADERDLRRELVFCLLGGHGVTYELGRSATRVVMALDPFHDLWSHDQLRQRLEHELRKPQFEPACADGAWRRYRFPARKARLVSDAVVWVRDRGGLRSGLAAQQSEDERRQWLCDCPGVGLKTASWLLRNCGWAERLAILDVHVLRALAEAGVSEKRPSSARDYLEIERAYLQWAEQLDASPAELDLFLWDVQRAR